MAPLNSTVVRAASLYSNGYSELRFTPDAPFAESVEVA
jgi:hypothetical protein